MIYGLNSTEIQFLEEKLIFPLKQNGAKVFVFGSRANGKFQKFSDIDLLYEEDPSRPIPAHLIYFLLNVIEESQFPYKIDLVNSKELANSYKDSVDCDKIEI